MCFLKAEKDIDIVSHFLFVIEIGSSSLRELCMIINVIILVLYPFYKPDKISSNGNTEARIK